MEKGKGARRPLAIALAVCGVLIILVVGYFVVAYGIVELKTLDVVHDAVVDKAIDDSDAIIDELKKDYPDLAEHLSSNEPRTYAIPGLVRAKNVRAKGKDKGKVGYATDMTPQGLAVTEDYVIVSAYSRSHGFHSVLWVLDRTDRSFVKTVVLDNCDHVGGLAYDGDRGRLWVCAKQPGGSDAALGCTTMDEIEAYNFDDSGTCLSYDDIYALDGIKHTSFVALFDNVIYAGDFEPKKNGTLGCYALDDAGYPTSVGDDSDTSNGVAPEHTVSIPKEIQGIAFCDGMLVLTQSLGDHDAHLIAYKDVDVDDLGDLTDENCVLDQTMPPYLEQATGVGTDLYVVFESSAKEYRSRKGVFGIDHVLKLDVSHLDEGVL